LKLIYKMSIAPLTAMICLSLIGALSFFALQHQTQRLESLNNITFAGFSAASSQTIMLGKVHAEIYAKMAILPSLEDEKIQAFSKSVEKTLRKLC